MINQTLPIPNFFNESKVSEIYQVAYAERTADARAWKTRYKDVLSPLALDSPKVVLQLIDVQNTFCIPTGELYVGGQSGTGAVDDNIRLCKYIYENLANITKTVLSLDTHRNISIFHEVFWVNDEGEHPTPAVTTISADDVKGGEWKVNPSIAHVFGGDYMGLQKYAIDYTETLEKLGRYSLIIWPYHAMLGGVGHAIVPAVEEAIFFHNMVRTTMPDFQIKGGNPLTENYSIYGAEVRNAVNKAQKNTAFISELLENDIIIIAGQAKSHCVAWTIEDLLAEIQNIDPALAKKVYILEDATSPVVVPGVIDFTDIANEAFDKFKNAGMNIITTQTPIHELV